MSKSIRRVVFGGLFLAVAGLAYLGFASEAASRSRAAPHADRSTIPVTKSHESTEVAQVPKQWDKVISGDSIRFTDPQAVAALGIRTSQLQLPEPPQALRLPGTLGLDPNRFVHVHSRFSGEIVEIGTVQDNGQSRTLRYGDHVKAGALLARIWSREVGEKKSELVDAITRLKINRDLLSRIETSRGLIPERDVMNARRDVEAGVIALQKAERTLLSWRISPEEIAVVKQEAAAIVSGDHRADAAGNHSWAEFELRAAIDGIIVEKNYNVGDIVEPEVDLFEIADLRRLQVMVNVYQENIASLRDLPVDRRCWKLDLKSDPKDNAIPGTFELIGSMIDPAQRTGVLIGWIENPQEILAVGQFITATIELLPDNHLAAVAPQAIMDDAGVSSVFVETAPLTFERRVVEPVRRGSDVVFIRKVCQASSDLPATSCKLGDTIVVSGLDRLRGQIDQSSVVALRQ